MWERYLDQDRVWPSAEGTELALEEMSPAHRLSVLLSLERLPGTAAQGSPLVRRLRDLTE